MYPVPSMTYRWLDALGVSSEDGWGDFFSPCKWRANEKQGSGVGWAPSQLSSLHVMMFLGKNMDAFVLIYDWLIRNHSACFLFWVGGARRKRLQSSVAKVVYFPWQKESSLFGSKCVCVCVCVLIYIYTVYTDNFCLRQLPSQPDVQNAAWICCHEFCHIFGVRISSTNFNFQILKDGRMCKLW